MTENIIVEVSRDESSPWIRASEMAGPKLIFSFFFILLFFYVVYEDVFVKPSVFGFLYGFSLDIIFFGLPVVLLTALSKAIVNYNVVLPSVLVGSAIIGIFIAFLAYMGAFSLGFWSFYSNGPLVFFFALIFYLWAAKKAFERPAVISNFLSKEKYYDFYNVRGQGERFRDEQEFHVYKVGNKYIVEDPFIGIRVEANSVQAGIERAKQLYIRFIMDYEAGKYQRWLYVSNEDAEGAQNQPRQEQESEEKFSFYA